jgi:hypothetical protein
MRCHGARFPISLVSDGISTQLLTIITNPDFISQIKSKMSYYEEGW